MTTTNEQIIVGLDIGTTKISAIVGRKNEFGKIEVLGMGRTESHGVLRGVVANIEKTVDAIKRVVAQASERSGHEIKEVYVGIAGQHIRSLQHSGVMVRDQNDDEISRSDIKRLIDDMYKIVLQPGEKIIHALPQEYVVDNEKGIKEPVGMAGVRLEANFHIITGQMAAIKNIHRCVEKAGLKVKDLILEPLASSAAVLSPMELEAGVALVDIGGGTTDIAIFQDEIIRHTAVIPFGGNVITEDIKEGCLIMRNQAEQLKVKFGSALAQQANDNEIVSIPGLRGYGAKEISVRNLAHIIQARMEEILEYVYYEIKHSGFENKLIGGIVLTGGGSELRNLVQLVEYVTGMAARIGYPTEHLTKTEGEEVGHPMYSTGVGLIVKGFEDEDWNGVSTLKKESKKQEAEVGPKDHADDEDYNAMEADKSAQSRDFQKPKQRWFERLFQSGKKFFDEDDPAL